MEEKKKQLIISIPLTEDEQKMYELISDDKYALHIFFNQCMKKLRSQLYINYHTYKDYIRKDNL